jgi:hypothetical protein
MGMLSPLLSYNVAIVTWWPVQVDQAPLLRRNNPPVFRRQNGLLAAICGRRDTSCDAAGAVRHNGKR